MWTLVMNKPIFQYTMKFPIPEKFYIKTGLCGGQWGSFQAQQGGTREIQSTQTGPRLNIKTVLSTYGDFHVKDKTAVRTSYL